MFPSNLHTHTHFSDGTHAPEKYIIKAAEAGLKAYGFSDHAPLEFGNFNWCMKADYVDAYLTEIRRLAEKYTSTIEIATGFEVDYIPDIVYPEKFSHLYPDFIIGSVHFLKMRGSNKIMEIDGGFEKFSKGYHQLFKGDARALVECYFDTIIELAQNHQFDILGHCDKIKLFLSQIIPNLTATDWYALAEEKAAIAIAESEKIIEINTRPLYKKHFNEPYPSYRMIRRIAEAGGKLTLSADTHDPDGVSAYFGETLTQLKYIGVKNLYYYQNKSWHETSIIQF